MHFLIAAGLAMLLATSQSASACQQFPTIFFGLDPVMHRPEAVIQLQNFAGQALSRIDDIEAIGVVGHSDRTGPRRGRQEIADRRAQAIADLLMAYSIPGHLIKLSGASDASPFVETPDQVREPLNRRVELTVRLLDEVRAAPPATPAGLSPLC